MEGTKNRLRRGLSIWTLCWIIVGAAASNKEQIYKAYIGNDMNLWKKTMDQMMGQKNKTTAFQLELLNYHYGYIAWCIGNKLNERAEIYLTQAESIVKQLEKEKEYKAYTCAYRSALYGYRIGLNKIKAPFIGPKSVECAREAMKTDAFNPYGYIQYGNAQFYMPPVFGGSKKSALNHFLKAKTLMERDPQNLQNDWNYLSLLTMLVKVYAELGNYQQAKSYCELILEKEPGYAWVKQEIYPEILKKTK